MTSELIPHSTVEEIVARRDRALELYREAHAAIARAHDAVELAEAEVRAACAGVGEGFRSYTTAHHQEIEAFRNAVQMPPAAQYLETARRLTDLRVWASIVERTDLDALMDREAKEQLRAQMAYVPEHPKQRRGVIRGDEPAPGMPDVTVEAVYATLQAFAQDAGSIFRRGLANAFSRLDRRFRSHDGFKIGARMILSNAFDSWGTWNYYRNERDTLQDVERVFLVLDGKSPRATYAGIVGVIETNRKGLGVKQSEHVGDYFKVRIFKNGNAHLWFTRPDLVQKANKLLAEHYGATVGEGKDREPDAEAPLHERAVGHARNLGYFPSPPPVVTRLFEDVYPIEGKRLLEPSAGCGALVREAVKLGAIVNAVELSLDRSDRLDYAGANQVLYRDFLELRPHPSYDLVVMNPPFDRGRDIDHVMHAFQFLKPGGSLHAVMSASTEFRSDAKATAFRAKMEKMGARWTDLPPGSFAPSTYVNAVILRVFKKG